MMYKWTKDFPKRPGLYFYRRTDIDMSPRDFAIIRVKKLRDGKGTLACFVVMECPKVSFFRIDDMTNQEALSRHTDSCWHKDKIRFVNHSLFAGPIHEPSYE